MFKINKNSVIVFLTLIALSSLGYFLAGKEEIKNSKKEFEVSLIQGSLGTQLDSSGRIENDILESDEENFKLDYTFDDKLSNYVEKRLRYYRPDRAAVVVMDSVNGDILTSVGFDRKTKSFDNLLPFTGTHPSASLFKIITSAELLEDGEVDGDTKFNYRGRGTTLYRYQLKNKKSRWTRSSSFERAFAFSNNVIFGKAAIQNTTPFELKEMAERFGFNKSIMQEIDMAKSTFLVPKEGYNLAEIASGFNKKTMMSPVHCAALSSVVANNGEMVSPRLVKSVKDSKGNVVWNNEVEKFPVLGEKAVGELKDLMQATVKMGTARKHFRRMRRKVKNSLDIGGKTGSITGGFPFGKRDWFTSFAIPKDQSSNPISVCVMIINYEKWYVRSAKLAQEIIQYYYTKK